MRWHDDPASDGPRGPPSGGLQGGTCRDTDPLQRPTESPPCSPGGGSAGALTGARLPGQVPEPLSNARTEFAYAARTRARQDALDELNDGCCWELHLAEIAPAYRELVEARRSLHIRLQNDQTRDDQDMAESGIRRMRR